MVKAGVYLVAVLDPVFTATPGWRPITLTLGRRRRSSAGGGRRAAGAAAGRHQVLLAYGTVSQLGFLIVLTGLSTRAAALGGLALIISDALFKSTLFLVGIVDHTARTRDLRKLTAVGRSMPVVSIAAVVTGASMVAIPSTIGFTAKEAAFEAMTYLAADRDGARVPGLPAVLLAFALVAGSALTVGYTLRFLWGAFATKSGRQFHVDAEGADESVTPCHRLPTGFAPLQSCWPHSATASPCGMASAGGRASSEAAPMTITDGLDLLGAALVLLGAFLCFAAAAGLVRFPDVLSRTHAATKPQTLGLILVAAGGGAVAAFLGRLRHRAPDRHPAGGHRPGGRPAGGPDGLPQQPGAPGLIARDDLADDLAAAGFELGPADQSAVEVARTTPHTDRSADHQPD